MARAADRSSDPVGRLRRGSTLYNPHLLNREDLRQLFVARLEVLAELTEAVRSAQEHPSQQHQLIVGQRGMGKTMLLRRLKLAVEEDERLKASWLALTFPEDHYNVAQLSDFWHNCLAALVDELEREDRLEEAHQLQMGVEKGGREDETWRSKQALATLTSFSKAAGKRLLLLVDNLDLVFDRVRDQQWALRETLSTNDRFLLVGACSRAPETSYRYDLPFYDFFQVRFLEGLDLESTRSLLLAWADYSGGSSVRQIVEQDLGRIQSFHGVTDGEPRLAALLYDILSSDPRGDARSDLERLLDHSTPFYKARLDHLAPQAQHVFHGLALGQAPMTAGALADALQLEVNTVSSQLNRLVQQGVVQKAADQTRAKVGYRIAERLFNLWYQARMGRHGANDAAPLSVSLTKSGQEMTGHPGNTKAGPEGPASRVAGRDPNPV